MNDGLLILCIIFIIIGLGGQPSIKVSPIPDSECEHVVVSRFFGLYTQVDVELCEGDEFNFEGLGVTTPTLEE